MFRFTSTLHIFSQKTLWMKLSINTWDETNNIESRSKTLNDLNHQCQKSSEEKHVFLQIGQPSHRGETCFQPGREDLLGNSVGPRCLLLCVPCFDGEQIYTYLVKLTEQFAPKKLAETQKENI